MIYKIFYINIIKFDYHLTLIFCKSNKNLSKMITF